MKKHTLIILLSIVTIIVSSQLNPLRRDTKSIEEMVLNRIPYKTGFYAAKKIIEESGWSVEYVNMKYGYALFGKNGETMLGEKYICVYLGAYRNFFVTDVSAFLVFDEQSKLMRVIVQKDTDGL